MDGRRSSAPGIVVLDNDRLVVWTLEDCVRKLGYTAHRAETADKALHILQTFPEIRLLVTEVNMPLLGGYDFIHIAQHLRPDIETIIVTGDIYYRADLHKGFQILFKPFHPRQLEEAILAALAPTPVDV
jgi:DNA-binding NtrC family response regulator